MNKVFPYQNQHHLLLLPFTLYHSHGYTVYGVYGVISRSYITKANYTGRNLVFYIRTQPSLIEITRLGPSLIHAARPTLISPVANIVFRLKFVLFWKVRTDGRTYERTTCAKTMITTGRDCGSASWINNKARSVNVHWILLQGVK